MIWRKALQRLLGVLIRPSVVAAEETGCNSINSARDQRATSTCAVLRFFRIYATESTVERDLRDPERRFDAKGSCRCKPSRAVPSSSTCHRDSQLQPRLWSIEAGVRRHGLSRRWSCDTERSPWHRWPPACRRRMGRPRSSSRLPTMNPGSMSIIQVAPLLPGRLASSPALRVGA